MISKSQVETQKLALEFAAKVKNGAIIALFGDLGSGKTTFVQGLAQGLGISERIISPTFLTIREYNLQNSRGKFYHVDLYRLQREDIGSIGLGEIITYKENIVVIEWAERAKNILPNKYFSFQFTFINDNERKIEFTKFSKK